MRRSLASAGGRADAASAKPLTWASRSLPGDRSPARMAVHNAECHATDAHRQPFHVRPRLVQRVAKPHHLIVAANSPATTARTGIRAEPGAGGRP